MSKVEVFVTKITFLNVTGLLDLTLKHNKNQIRAIKYSVQQLNVHSQQKYVPNILKLTIKTPERCLVVSIVNFEHILHFAQRNAGWA